MKKCNSKSSKKKRPNLFETFTKMWVTILMVIAVLDLQLSYVLAYLGRDQIAESLSVAVVTEIIGVIGIYMVRAFFDSAAESKFDLEKNKITLNEDIDGEEDTSSEEETDNNENE